VAAGLRHRAGRGSGAGARVRVARELSRAGVLAAGATGLGWRTERSTVHRALFPRAGGAAVALRATHAAPLAWAAGAGRRTADQWDGGRRPRCVLHSALLRRLALVATAAALDAVSRAGCRSKTARLVLPALLPAAGGVGVWLA